MHHDERIHPKLDNRHLVIADFGILKKCVVQNILKNHERSLWSAQGDANEILFEDHISESIRRLCAYARDFGETLLNMLAHEMMITERRQE